MLTIDDIKKIRNSNTTSTSNAQQVNSKAGDTKGFEQEAIQKVQAQKSNKYIAVIEARKPTRE